MPWLERYVFFVEGCLIRTIVVKSKFRLETKVSVLPAGKNIGSRS